MKTTPISGFAGQNMVLTLDRRSGDFTLVTNLDGRRIEILKLKQGQQTFTLPLGDVCVEQSNNADGLFTVMPLRSGGVIPGLSAYEIAVQNGFTGTEEAWLKKLEGVGESIYDIAVRNGFKGTEAEFIKSLEGSAGTGVFPGTVIWSSNPAHLNGGSLPNGWLPCNGASVKKTVYADLYKAIGTTYGTGSNANEFRLPNLMDDHGRVIRSVDYSGKAVGTQEQQANGCPAPCGNEPQSSCPAIPGSIALIPLIKH